MAPLHMELLEGYGVDCVDSRDETRTTITSHLFRRFDDFATFALIIGDHVGDDWSIPGFLPGTIRGRSEFLEHRLNDRERDN